MSKTVWVTCPVCGEHGMPKELEEDYDAEAGGPDGIITCTNLACGSNGGDNWSKAPQPERGPTFLERFGRAIKAFAEAF